MHIFQVWCVDGSAKTALPKEDFGKFHSGDCYIVLYTYHSGDKREEFYLTYWIGKNSILVIGFSPFSNVLYTAPYCWLYLLSRLFFSKLPHIFVPFLTLRVITTSL